MILLVKPLGWYMARVYGLQRAQHLLPLNPEHLGAVPPDLAMNTAVSFATNANWQSYGGETTPGSMVNSAAMSAKRLANRSATFRR